MLSKVEAVNFEPPDFAAPRRSFTDLVTVSDSSRVLTDASDAMIARPNLGLCRGQRGLLLAAPQTDRTTMLRFIVEWVHRHQPTTYSIVLLIEGRHAIAVQQFSEISEVVSVPLSDAVRVVEFVLEKAKRLVEHKKDVLVILDAITHFAHARQAVVGKGRDISHSFDAPASRVVKQFLAAARAVERGGSLTILASAVAETGSPVDDVSERPNAATTERLKTGHDR